MKHVVPPVSRLVFAVLLSAACTLYPGCALIPARMPPVRPATSGPAPAKGHRSADLLPGKTWLLAGLRTGGRFIPLEPEHGSTACLVFKPDGTLEGTTGTNTFTAVWTVRDSRQAGNGSITITLTGTTRKTAPNETAARFERELLDLLSGTHGLKTEKDSVQFLGERDEILIRFIFRSPDRN